MNKIKYPIIIITAIIVCLASYYFLIKRNQYNALYINNQNQTINDLVENATTISATTSHSKKDNEEIIQQINDVITNGNHGKCGIYIKNLKTDEQILINADEEFFPASIYKLPLAILILSYVDSGQLSLDDTFIVNNSHVAYSYDPLASQIGSEVSTRYLLDLLIKNSDNTAQKLLVNEVIGGYEQYNQKIIDELGIDGFQGDFETLSVTPREVGQLLENIYDDSYLSKKSNDYLIDLLSNTSSNFNDRIVAGVPGDVQIAHKIGQLDTIYQDAGIVYSDNDYIIVLLNEDIISYNVASDKISKISNLVWDYFNQ